MQILGVAEGEEGEAGAAMGAAAEVADTNSPLTLRPSTFKEAH